MRTKTYIAFIGTCLVPILALAQTSPADKDLTAREMFMAARAKSLKKEAPKSAAMPGAVPGPRHSRTEPDARETPTAEASTPVNTPAAAPVERSLADTSAAEPAPGARAEAIPVGYSSAPLGLRYGLIKVLGDRNDNVSADAIFHSGDHMKVAVEVSDAGYLYVINQGSSGTWELLFPSAAVENGDNHVMPGRTYAVPPGHVFTFAGQPGTEKLFVIFSRQPEPEMDRLIYTLKKGNARPLAQPVEPKPSSPGFLLSSNKPIDNSVVDKLRDVYSRDLIIEKAENTDQSKPATQQDKSVYVVNRDDNAGARVVADISLIHQ